MLLWRLQVMRIGWSAVRHGLYTLCAARDIDVEPNVTHAHWARPTDVIGKGRGRAGLDRPAPDIVRRRAYARWWIQPAPRAVRTFQRAFPDGPRAVEERPQAGPRAVSTARGALRILILSTGEGGRGDRV